MLFVISLLYIAGWSVLESSSGYWNCSHQIIHRLQLERENFEPLFIPKYFSFTFIKRKVPAVDDHKDEDEASNHFSKNV